MMPGRFASQEALRPGMRHARSFSSEDALMAARGPRGVGPTAENHGPAQPLQVVTAWSRVFAEQAGKPAVHRIVYRTSGCDVPWRPDAARGAAPRPWAARSVWVRDGRAGRPL
jgi:hypothetical protein